LTQYQNPVMNVKLKITRFCNWLQSLWFYFCVEVFRYRMLILIGGWILLKNSDFQSRNAKSLDFGPESCRAKKYTVTLKVKNAVGSNTVTKIIGFSVKDNLTQFSTSPTGSDNHLSPLRFQSFNRKVFWNQNEARWFSDPVQYFTNWLKFSARFHLLISFFTVIEC